MTGPVGTPEPWAPVTVPFDSPRRPSALREDALGSTSVGALATGSPGSLPLPPADPLLSVRGRQGEVQP